MPRPPQKAMRKGKRTNKRRNTEAARVVIPSLVVPATTIVTLRYKDTTLSRLNAGGANFSVFSLRLNDVYDPDPALSSGSITGFAQWAAFYNHYRVRSVTVRWQLGNFTAAPIYAYMLATTNNIVPATVFGAIDLTESPLATKPRLLAPAGSYPNVAVMRKKFDLATVMGNKQEYYSNADFTGTATASPSSPLTRIYLQFIAYSSVSWSQATNSDLELDYEVEFFGRYPLTA